MVCIATAAQRNSSYEAARASARRQRRAIIVVTSFFAMFLSIAAVGLILLMVRGSTEQTSIDQVRELPMTNSVIPTQTLALADLKLDQGRLLGLGVDTALTKYADCSGQSPLPEDEASVDLCAPSGVIYFVGHNPGVFTPLMKAVPGDIITWQDRSGAIHRFIVTSTRDVLWKDGFPKPTQGSVAEFQTCATPDGSIDRIVDASLAP
jgi:hypothetical protein